MQELVIEAGRTEKNYWSDLWRFRELFYILAWRDISVRYKQTAIGVIWAILRPLLAMIIFTVIFGRIAKMPSNGIPYPILVFAAMLPWQFFANSLSEASLAMPTNRCPGEGSNSIFLFSPFIRHFARYNLCCVSSLCSCWHSRFRRKAT